MPKTVKNKNEDCNSQKTKSAEWFRTLQNRICTILEEIEDELSEGPASELHAGRFAEKSWDRSEGGGGRMRIMREGRVFEKAGVNFSEVWGHFSEEFRAQIPGAAENDGAFWASGISLVVHPRSPLVPAVHMNTRMIVTAKGWFGGGADLTPVFPDEEETKAFHNALKECCDRHDPAYYPEYKAWCDRYFYLPHRDEPRGIGGIFYDQLNSADWDADFAFTQDVGETFAQIYPDLVRRNMHRGWSEEQREAQLVKRGRYVEFNLLYDRGTQFGLKTGGNTEAILMSLPPNVKWP